MLEVVIGAVSRLLTIKAVESTIKAVGIDGVVTIKVVGIGADLVRAREGNARMVRNRVQRLNVAVAVGVGTFIWVLVLRMLLPENVGLGWFLLLALWIGAGAGHLVNNIRDFRDRMSPRKLLIAAIVSPAWPWLKWRDGEAGNQERPWRGSRRGLRILLGDGPTRSVHMMSARPCGDVQSECCGV